MDKNVSYYEVDITFKTPSGATVPVTASTEEEAREIALHLFQDYESIAVSDVRNISTQPVTLLN
jgi:hypothetical protein